jgi:hypothetical protein
MQHTAHLAQTAWRAFPGRRRVSGGVSCHQGRSAYPVPRPLPRMCASRACMAELWSFARVVLRTALPADHRGSSVDGRVESPYQRFRAASMRPITTTISWAPQHGRMHTVPSAARQGCLPRLSRSWRCIGVFSVRGARAAKPTAQRAAPRGARSGCRLAARRC